MGAEDCMALNRSRNSTDNEQSDCLLPDTLAMLKDDERYIFMGIFVVLSVLALCGNCAAIYSISKRKYRYVQKTCIISLAVSDILSTIVIATNNLETFSHELIIWSLGSFLCSVIPMLQMTGIMASSVALMIIAMDRYRNVVHALSKRWNPSPATCLIITTTFWIIILGVSYPMYDFFNQAPVTIVYIIDPDTNKFEFVDAQVCVSFDKKNMRVYYIIMVIIIFLPLLMVFVWFYYNIASLVWKHRKPVSMAPPLTAKTESSNSNALENSTSISEIKLRNVKREAKHRDIKVERKIRTFKIIITLMLVFISCRLPYFTVFILKLSLTTEDYGKWTWYLNYSFIALHIVNCCLNPLLYTFLNPTLTVWIRVKKSLKAFVWEICCFCFSKGEFDEFEKENPFANEFNRSRGNSKVKFEEDRKEAQGKY